MINDKINDKRGQVFNLDISWFYDMKFCIARPLRIEYDGAVYHVTSRGNEKKIRDNIKNKDQNLLTF
jgi:hypothetical protein